MSPQPGGARPAEGLSGRAEAGTQAGTPLRVTTLELFFDLVFAFTLTQLTVVLAGGPGATGRVLLMFGLLWWMYEGYAWLVTSAVLGLALAAALWWVILGGGDAERAEEALTAAPSERRTGLALSALFYSNVPLLLGLVGMAAGVAEAIAGHRAGLSAAAVLAAGAVLFLAGVAAIRRLLGTGPVRFRAGAAAVALATIPAGTLCSLNLQVGLLIAVLTGMLLAEWRWGAEVPESRIRETGESR